MENNRYKILPVVNEETVIDKNLSYQLYREIGTQNYGFIGSRKDFNTPELDRLWVDWFKTRNELIDLHVVEERKPEPDEWGVGHATGIKIPGKGYKGRGHYLFFNDGSTTGKLNALCGGSMTVVCSSRTGLDVPLIPRDFVFMFSNVGPEEIKEVTFSVDEDGAVNISKSKDSWNREELVEVLEKFGRFNLSPEEFVNKL